MSFLFTSITGTKSVTSSAQPLTNGRFDKVTGWAVSDANFNRNIDGTQRDITVTSNLEGIYLISFTPKISGVTTGYRAGVYINGNVVIQGRASFTNTGVQRQESMPMSLALKLKANDVLTFEVQAENSGQILSQQTSRSLLQVDVASSNLTEGLSAVTTIQSNFNSGITPTIISGWNTISTGNFLAKNVSITPAGTLAVLRPGVFKVSAQIIVRNPSNQARYIHTFIHSFIHSFFRSFFLSFIHTHLFIYLFFCLN